MALYVIGDLHLSLTGEKPMDKFGPVWENHPAKLIEGFRELSGEDVTVLCGDLSWAMSLESAGEDFAFIDRLPGRKLILKGNHDYWWSTANKAYRFFLERGLDSMDILHNNAWIYDRYALCGTRGWFFEGVDPQGTDREKIVAREAGRLQRSLEAGKALQGKELLVFLHFPPVFGDFVCRELIDVLKQFGVKRCFYGHIHGQYALPRTFEYDGISFTITSADYLQFLPLRVT